MPKEAVFTMKLEADLRDQFMAATEDAHRPASQVVRELMRDYIEQRRQARDYDEFLHRKVELARRQRDAGQHFSHEEVEAKAAARRTELQRRAIEAGS
ncbi:antitoxin of toxin-antitoxin stability system [Variovorax paradoxus]|nr:antitoxin of toxin-antitoxin stability system [Variovorax paradoxus]